MDPTDKTINEIRAQIQKTIAANKTELEKILKANQAAITKAIETSKAAVEKANGEDREAPDRLETGQVINDLETVPGGTTHQDLVDDFLRGAGDRVDQAVNLNRAVGQETIGEILQITGASLEKITTHMNKSLEIGQGLFNKKLLEVQDLVENAAKESKKLLDQTLSGVRSNVALRSLPMKHLSSPASLSGLRPASLRKTGIRPLSDGLGASLIEKVETQIGDIETDRGEQLSTILYDLKGKLADIQFDLAQKGTTDQIELSKKMDLTLNQLYQDSFNLINNLSHDLKKVKSNNHQGAVDLTSTAQSQILTLQSKTIKALSIEYQAFKRNNDNYMTMLIPKSDLLSNAALSTAEQTVMVVEQKLIELKSNLGKI
jgi:hypothetical protein